MNQMQEEGVERALLEEFLVSHIIEELLFNDLFDIINYIYNSNDRLTDFEKKVKNYFESKELKNKGITGILLHKEGEHQLIIQNNETNQWKLAEPEDYNDLAQTIANNVISIKSLSNLSKLDSQNNIIGFMSWFKKDDYMIFKVKLLNKKRNKGARCDQAGKSDTIQLSNLIIGSDKFTTTNTKGVNQKQMCVLQEFTLRLYDYNRKNDKRWFLDPFEAIGWFRDSLDKPVRGIEKLEL